MILGQGPYIIETDSSDFAHRTVLLQGNDGLFVAFEGRKLQGVELNYPIHEKDLLAIQYALRKWRVYLDKGLPITTMIDSNT
jgi:hypothetical protein